MSVIGYDGKIRPKSVAVNVRPQGTMTPEQMERLHNERPDYVSGVMKIIDSVNRNVDATAGYFDRLHEEEAAIEDKNQMLEDDKKLAEEYQRISSDESMSAQQKADAWAKHARAYDPNMSRRDRLKALQYNSTWLRYNNSFLTGLTKEKEEKRSIEIAHAEAQTSEGIAAANSDSDPEAGAARAESIEARLPLPSDNMPAEQQRSIINQRTAIRNTIVRLKAAAEAAKKGRNETEFGAYLNVAVKNASTMLESEIPKWLREKKNENDIPSLLEEIYDKAVASVPFGDQSPEQKEKLASSKAAWMARSAAVYSAKAAEYNTEESQKNLSQIVASASTNAANPLSAYTAALEVASQYPESCPTEFDRSALAVSAAWGNLSDIAANELRGIEELRGWLNSSEAVQLAANDPAAVDKKAAEIEEEARRRIESLAEAINEYSAEVEAEIDGNELLTRPGANGNTIAPDQPAILKKMFNDNKNKLLDSLRNTKTVSRAAITGAAKAAKAEASAMRLENLRDVFSGKGVPIIEANVWLYNGLALGGNDEASRAAAAKADAMMTEELGVSSEQIFSAYAKRYYAGLPEPDVKERAFYDIKFALASLNLKDKGDDNVGKIETLLDGAAKLFGRNSEQYRDLCAFVRKNIVNEKNGADLKNIVNGVLYPGKTEKEINEARANASIDELNLIDEAMNFLSEIPLQGGDLRKEAERVLKVLKNTMTVRRIVSVGSFTDELSVAKAKALEDKETAKQKVYSKKSQEVEDEGDRIRNEAELQALNEGKSPDAAKKVGEKAEEAYYKELVKNDGGRDVTQDGFSISYKKIALARAQFSEKIRNEGRIDEETEAANRKRLAQLEEKIKSFGEEAWAQYENGGLTNASEEAVKEHGPAQYAVRAKLQKRLPYLDPKRAKELVEKYPELETSLFASGPRDKRSIQENIDYATKLLEKYQKIEDRKNELAKQNEEIAGRQAARKMKTKRRVLARHEKVDPSLGYGERTDGTQKGTGWFGPIKLPDGSVMTELSTTIEVDGVSMDIPMITPLTTKEELDFLARVSQSEFKKLSKEDKEMLREIEDKAYDWAMRRLKEERSPYIENGEKEKPLPKEDETSAKKQLPALDPLPEAK